MRRAPLTCLLFFGIPVTPAHAQRDTTARLAGTARSSINGLPISGVMVAVRGSRVFDVSDSTGSFTLVGLPDGRQTVRLLYGDSLSYEREINLRRGKTLTLSVLLDVAAVELSPIVVEANGLHAERSLAGFYDRRKWRFGRFYTLEELERRHALSTRVLLLESGVQVRCGIGSCLALGSSGARTCVMSLFLDGMRLPADELDLIRPDELAGVEVYKHSSDVPMEFQFGIGRGCGAVVMWRRR
jgi:hypothetical protein